MSKFDTHGGYFAPKDYMKVEAGGSPEENPNGGVQIGVDQEGTPNLLEEGEPVYKDYVYSDNIKASERFLKENNIPEKYAGELYSKIADSFFSEAENRPYDPISRNGLEAMLGRLADAQEGQKAYNEQRQLERELKNLSPDELAALEEMLAAGEHQAMEQQVAPAEPVQQPMMPQEPMAQEQVPMMGCGGKINRFDTGGPERKTLLESPAMVQAITGNPSTYATSGNQIPRVESTVGNELGYLADVATSPLAITTPALTGAGTVSEVAGMVSDTAESPVNRAELQILIRDAEGKPTLSVDAGGKYHGANNKIMSKAKAQALMDEHKAALTAAAKTTSKFRKGLKAAGKWGAIGGGVLLGGSMIKGLVDAVQDDKEAQLSGKSTGSFTSVRDYSSGGKVNKFDGEDKSALSRPWVGWPSLWSPTNIGYTLYPTIGNGRQPSGAIGTYQTLQGYKWPGQLKVDDAVIPNPEEIVLDPVVPPKPVTRKKTYPNPLNDIVTATNARIASEDPINRSLGLPAGPGIAMPEGYDEHQKNEAASLAWDWLNKEADRLGIGTVPSDYPQIDITSNHNATVTAASPEQDNGPVIGGNPYLSTLPRYAGAIGSGLLGLYNALQRPDEYTATRYKPFTPSGRISLQDQVYNPVDQNMMMNQVLAQGNSSQRALRNSGLGPSTAAAMVAQDNNITGNLGNTFLQTWDANNQRRNQVIAANNQNEAQRAQFDANIDYYRQRALADAQMRNAYTDLQIQQLNNEAEGAKYAAVSNQISNALQALSGIGQENFAMNQVNSNPANEGYGILGGGIGAYLPYYYRRNYKCGGKKK